MNEPATQPLFVSDHEDKSNRDSEDPEAYLSEAVAFMALSSIPGVGYWKLYKLADSGLSFKSVLKSASFEEFEGYLSVKISSKSRINWSEFQKSIWKKGNDEIRVLFANNILVMFSWQDCFPLKLKNIEDPPYWLFVQGNTDNLHAPSVAIIGTRKPDDDGLFLTKFLTALLAPSRVVTISGLADGVDQSAHINSIKFALPTVAILGTGIYRNFPKGSEKIRDLILRHSGTIISEYLPNESYSKQSFVRRNRLQVGLANLVCPVQWQHKSGTARAVEFAIKYDRPILQLKLPLNEIDSDISTMLLNSPNRTWILEAPNESTKISEVVRSSLGE